ncbi:MAG TPA: sigma 54-interacting transcriptional regulator [Pirellulales bacterium]|nr:sigma 54-interacting transcriptional regulator [Pirellulales bacterium]
MPPSRASTNELGKLLGAVAEPLYVVAATGRMVFVNDACSHWVGSEAAALVGQECRYSSAAELTGAAAVAVALCPPPEAFAGSRLKAPLVLPGGAEQPSRQVEFIPLSSADETVAAVLALVSPQDTTAAPEGTEELAATHLHARLQAFRGRLAMRYHVDRLIGDSPAMRRVRAQVKLAAASSAHVLVLGPTGSRREHVGRAIHHGDGRGTVGPLVPLACPLLDVELLQATLRTLSRSRQAGERPATLLLEEIDTLAEGAQSELFRAVVSGVIAARVVCTSRTPLTQLAERDLFRRDLAYLLSTVTISLPPLAERLADLPLLAQWYVEQANLRSTKQLGGCSPEALDRLADYPWPGDQAELEAVIAEAHRLAHGPLILPHELPARLSLASQATARPARVEETIVLEQYLATIEHELIVRALKRAKGNKTKAARLLGMTRPRFYRRLVQLGLAEA